MARNSATAKTVAPAADREVTTGHNQPPLVVDLQAVLKNLIQGEGQQENRQLSIAYAVFNNPEKYSNERLATLLKEPGKSIDLNKSHGLPDSITKANVLELLFCEASPEFRAIFIDVKTYKARAKQAKGVAKEIAINREGEKSALLHKSSLQKFKRALFCAYALRMGEFTDVTLDTDRSDLAGKQWVNYDVNGHVIPFVPSEEQPKDIEPQVDYYSGNKLEAIGRSIISPKVVQVAGEGSDTETATNGNDQTPQQKKAQLDARKKQLTATADELNKLGKEQAEAIEPEADKVLTVLLQNVYSEEGKGGKKVIVMEAIEAYVRLLFKGNNYVSVVHSYAQAVGTDDKAIKPEKSRLGARIKHLEEIIPEAPKPDLRDNAPKNGNGQDKKAKETAPTA